MTRTLAHLAIYKEGGVCCRNLDSGAHLRQDRPQNRGGCRPDTRHTCIFPTTLLGLYMRKNHLGKCGAEILGSALPRMKGVQRLGLQRNELCIPPGCALSMCVTMRRYMETYAKLMDLLGVVWM